MRNVGMSALHLRQGGKSNSSQDVTPDLFSGDHRITKRGLENGKTLFWLRSRRAQPRSVSRVGAPNRSSEEISPTELQELERK